MCSPGWGLNCFALVSGIAQLIFHEFYVAHDGPANGYRQRYGLLQSRTSTAMARYAFLF